CLVGVDLRLTSNRNIAAHNTIEMGADSGYAIRVISGYVDDDDGEETANTMSIVTGNQIRDVGSVPSGSFNSTGIIVQSGTAGTGFADSAIPRMVSITDNVIHKPNRHGILVLEGVEVAMRGNIVNKPGTNGIHAIEAVRPKLDGNMVFDAGRSGAAAGIYLDACTDVILKDNTSRRVESTSAQTYGVETANGTTFADTNGNDLDGTTSGTNEANINEQLIPSVYGTYGGTANAITVATELDLTTEPTGLEIRFRATSANTGATTINLDGLGAATAKTIDGSALPAGYIRTDVDTVARYDGTDWIVDRQIERGSNANGEYVRTADGSMKCTRNIAGSASAAVTWTYPVAFTALDAVNGGASSTSARVVTFSNVGTTSVDFDVWNLAGARTGQTAYLTAHGAWY
ncbi:MAG: right-handed parallel beta-helix repeat-containing protein, partial [Ruegeria sp.]|nr:right-handed parallel beta-helix repeat-containing protein [Ruegeria sp.]